ncbi:TPA: hypothetical protein EYP27_04255 [Candidatus Bathyarchaeota archaeon]|nr:hypothetical protein [Candidatus Bathyarchaeota archaeon]
MRIYILYRGPYGEQMLNNITKFFAEQIFGVYELKPETIEEEHPSEPDLWSKLWETPEEYVPKNLPIVECDLLIVLGIHSKLGDLIPPIAERLKAKAVLYPVCDRNHAPEARRGIQEVLEDKGIHVEFPEPFCILEKSENKLINEFAKLLGRPKFRIKLDKKSKTIIEVEVVRDTPCGTAFHVSQALKNFPYDEEEKLVNKIYFEHQNEDAENHCLAEMDPNYPLMQEAGDFQKDAVFEACGFSTAKDKIVNKIRSSGEISVGELKEIIVNGPGNWNNPEKACDADRTFLLYLDELISEGKIVKTDKKLKLAQTTPCT